MVTVIKKNSRGLVTDLKVYYVTQHVCPKFSIVFIIFYKKKRKKKKREL